MNDTKRETADSNSPDTETLRTIREAMPTAGQAPPGVSVDGMGKSPVDLYLEQSGDTLGPVEQAASASLGHEALKALCQLADEFLQVFTEPRLAERRGEDLARKACERLRLTDGKADKLALSIETTAAYFGFKVDGMAAMGGFFAVGGWLGPYAIAWKQSATPPAKTEAKDKAAGEKPL